MLGRDFLVSRLEEFSNSLSNRKIRIGLDWVSNTNSWVISMDLDYYLSSEGINFRWSLLEQFLNVCDLVESLSFSHDLLKWRGLIWNNGWC